MSKLQGALGFRTIGAGFALVAFVALGLSGASCGSSSSGTQPDNDAGNDTTSSDTPPGDTPKDTGPKPDVKPVDGDGGSTKPDIDSTLLAEGSFFLLDNNTTTADGNIVVIQCNDPPTCTNNSLVAIPAAGGAPQKIVDKPDFAFTTGSTVLVYTNINTKTNIGTMGVWTKASGYHELSTSAVAPTANAAAYAVSLDGLLVGYTDGAGPKTTNVAVNNTTGSAKKVIITGAENDAACSPFIVGTSTKMGVAYCTPPTTGGDAGTDAGDGGAAKKSASLSVYDLAGTATPIAPTLQPRFSVDKAGDKIFAVDLSGNAAVYPTDGSASLPIAANVLFGDIIPEGTKSVFVSYTTPADTNGPLNVADVSATPNPKKIADDKVVVFFNPVEAAKYMIYGTLYDSKTGLSDLKFAKLDGSTSTPIVVSTDPASAIFGDPFTADSKYAIYYTGVASGAGDINLIDVSTAGAKATKVAGNTWVSYSPKGQVVVYNDNWLGGGGVGGTIFPSTEGTGDIRLVDGPSGTPKLVGAQAENNFYISKDKTKIFFATSDPSFTKAGLYAATVP